VDCFACGRGIELASGQRVGFRDTCPACDADLHVCCNCQHHDPSAYNECRESSAERVSSRERANRCDYFRPGEGGGEAGGDAKPDPRSALDGLFKRS